MRSKLTSRALAALLAVVMVVGLLPMTALAARIDRDDAPVAEVAMGEEAVTAPVRTPSKAAEVAEAAETAETEYEYVLDTDGIDDGAVYAIVTSRDNNSLTGNRILYYDGSAAQTNQVSPSAMSGDTLSLDASYPTETQLWEASVVEGGIALRSLAGEGDKYLKLASDSAHEHVYVSEDPQALTITNGVSKSGCTGYGIVQGGYSLNWSSSKIYTHNDPNNVLPYRFYKQTSTEPEQPETPEKPRHYFAKVAAGANPWTIVSDGTGLSNTLSYYVSGTTYVEVTTLDASKPHRIYADSTGAPGNGFLNVASADGVLVAACGGGHPGNTMVTFEAQSNDTYLLSCEKDGTRYYLTAETKTYNGKECAVFKQEKAEAVPYFVENASSIYCVGPYTVNLNAGYEGAEDIAPISVMYGTTLPTPTREGYTFVGWFDGETEYTEATADVTLTAQWEIIPTEVYTPAKAEAEGKIVTYLGMAPNMTAGNRHWDGVDASGLRELKLYQAAGEASVATTGTGIALDTDGVDSGKGYVIYIPDSSKSAVMHYKDSATDQCSSINATVQDLLHLFVFEAEEDGYTIRPVGQAGKYLSLEASGSQQTFREEKTVFYITPVNEPNDGTYYIWTATEPQVDVITPPTEPEGPYTMAQTEFKGTSDKPMDRLHILNQNDDVDTEYRIPALITLDNGWIVAACDIRWSSTQDSPNNLDTIVSVSKDGGVSWEWEVINYFSDFAPINGGGQRTNSASFIDPALLVDSEGTLWMAVDLQPTNVNLGKNAQKTGSGFDEEGLLMVAPISEAEWAAKVNTSLGRNEATRLEYQAQYKYRVDINGVNSDSVTATAAKDGENVTVYAIFHMDTKENTGYYVDAFFDLYYDYGEGGIQPVIVAQKESTAYTQANLFYLQSPWKAYSTTYLMIRKATVEGDGLAWGDPQLISGVKNFDGETFLAFCPGRGTAIKLDGGTERIIFPVYDNVSSERASAVYTDDGGVTWHRGARVENGETVSNSESQIVELHDAAGNSFLRMFSRNTGNPSKYVSYADSFDNGSTWTATKYDRDMPNGESTMMSFIGLKGFLVSSEGEVYEDLVLASYPRGSASNRRSNGIVRLGYYDAENGAMVWLNDKDDIRYPYKFTYSCLTQLRDGDGFTDRFALLYEDERTWANNYGMEMGFDTFTSADLLGEGWALVQEVPKVPTIENTIVRDETVVPVIATANVLDLDKDTSGALTAAVTLTGEGADDGEEAAVTWTSSDESVATVSKSAAAQASLLSEEDVVTAPGEQVVINAVGVGRAYITATTTKNGITRKAVTEVVVQGEDGIIVPEYYLDEMVTADAAGTTAYTVSADGLEKLIAAGGDAVEEDYTETLELAATYTDKAKADAAQAQIDEVTKALYAKLTGRDYEAELPEPPEADVYAIGSIADYVYTGEAIEPIVIVRKNGAILTVGYTLEYKNNVNVGEATVNVVVGGKTVATGTFRIVEDSAAGDDTGNTGNTGNSSNSVVGYFVPSEEELDDPDVPLAELPMTFEDVKADDWFFEAAEFVFANDLMQGVSATEFRPSMNTTRGMVVTILHRMAKEPEAEPATFTDVASNAWYGPAVAWGAQSKVVQGAEDGDFHPMDAVTREQLATFLFRFAEYNGYDVSARGELSGYADSAVVSSWAKDAMSWAVGTGLITGKDGNVLAPLSAATRAELAAILTRFCQQFAEEK